MKMCKKIYPPCSTEITSKIIKELNNLNFFETKKCDVSITEDKFNEVFTSRFLAGKRFKITLEEIKKILEKSIIMSLLEKLENLDKSETERIKNVENFFTKFNKNREL
jgi:hypothetical protein